MKDCSKIFEQRFCDAEILLKEEQLALDSETNIAAYEAPKKNLYELGEMPPLGHVPKTMYAWTIRRERHGEPDKAFQVEVVETPKVGAQDVLVLVMAAG